MTLNKSFSINFILFCASDTQLETSKPQTDIIPLHIKMGILHKNGY